MKSAAERSGFVCTDGVWVQQGLSIEYTEFAKSYRELREGEGRSLSIEQIRKLPDYNIRDASFHEWQIRIRSVSRFLTYLKTKKTPLRILEIGCGNGFLAHLMAQDGHTVCGLDVAMDELRLATEAFGTQAVTWYCADVLGSDLPEPSFDIIVFAASLQYFPEPDKVILRCKKLLNDQGEIHIFDTPFYKKSDVEAAKKRSEKHFLNKHVPGFAVRYFHHTLDSLGIDNGNLRIIRSGMLATLPGKRIPFPWLIIS